MKSRALLCLFLLSLGGAMHAQTTVNGVVSDEKGMTIPGVTVSVKGSNDATITNLDGQYSLSAASDATIVYSFIGFATQEIAVKGRKVINVSLSEGAKTLDEVVVIGYGSQKKGDVNGSVSSVKARDIENLKQVSVDQMLQGKAAGVTVTNNSGAPGSNVSVKIRGITSLSGTNEPLYVIDGVPISGDARNSTTSGQPIGGGNLANAGNITVSPLSLLNPNDIEAIDVLKDASATAIYGSRGANGVVIITTKSGRKGTGKLSYDNSYSTQQQVKTMDVFNLREYAVNQNALAQVYNLPPRFEFSNPDILGEGTNWQKEIFKNSALKSHQLAFSGGKEGISYYMSGSYLEQEGTIIGSGYKRFTFKTNIDAKLKDWLKVGVNINFANTIEKITLNSSADGIISTSLFSTPDVAVRDLNGNFSGPPSDGSLGSFINPVASALLNTNKLKRRSYSGNFFAEFKLVKGLEYRFEVGGYTESSMNKEFRPSYQWGSAVNPTATLNQREQMFYSANVKNYLTYRNNFGKHNFTLLAGQEANQGHWEGLNLTASGFVDNDLQEIAVSDTKLLQYGGQFIGEQALYSYYGRVIYDFDNKYGITASWRADGSSKFAKGNKWGYFPAFSATWKLSNESFMAGTKSYVDNIKLKFGYGETGNQQIANNQYGSTITSSLTGIGQSFFPAGTANPDLIWETSKQTNAGIEFSLFKSALTTTVEVYRKVSEGFLYKTNFPLYLTGGETYEGGVSSPIANQGSMENKGIDLTINFSKKITENLTWNSTLIASKYVNKVLTLDNAINRDINVNGFLTKTITRTAQGGYVGAFLGPVYEGIYRDASQLVNAPLNGFGPDPAPFVVGDVIYRDLNGDGVVNEDDFTTIGNPNPDFTFGFTNSFNYKSIDLSVFLQGSVGNDIYNLTRRAGTLNSNLYSNQFTEAADYFSANNPNGHLPRLGAGQAHPNNFLSGRYIEDGSYLRIQNVAIGYSLPVEWISKLKITKLRIYGTIQNLYTFTKYKGYDPEVGSYNQDALLSGIDNGRYPTPRTMTMGFNIEF